MGNYDLAVLKLIHHTGIINLIILESWLLFVHMGPFNILVLATEN